MIITDAVMLAYLAGIIDGEGHVAYHSKGLKKKRRRFTIEVSMTYLPIIQLLQANLGWVGEF